jgi:hypothetical protein
MCRITLIALSIVVLSLPALAQDGTKGTLFGGYSYNRADVVNTDFDPNLNGWHVSVSRRLPFWIELEGDFSGHYGSSSGKGMRTHTVMFGPRFAAYGKKFSFYSHLLFGLSRIHADAAIPDTTTTAKSETSYAFAPGFGFDLRPHKKVGIRVIQLNYISTEFGSSSLAFARFSSGIVFYFGH